MFCNSGRVYSFTAIMEQVFTQHFKFTILLILINMLPSKVSSEEVVVRTNVGDIAGLQREIEIMERRVVVTEFLGIPYAEDTSGNNRFRRPVPKAQFNQTFKAFTISPPCLQLPTPAAIMKGMTEDCLMLNIFVPRNFSDSRTEKLPVMTWLHGGAFVSGSAKGYDGNPLAVLGDVLIVTVNYRLAEFGFLNVGDSRANGNQGLWDQHLAFKWIKNNIHAFLGDPDNITIFGESAGAASVSFHSLFAENKGLFRRVIAESGSALAYWSTHKLSNVSPLYRAAGCDTGPQDPIECLRNLSSEDFITVLRKPEIVSTGCCIKAPTVDGEFLVEKPVDIILGNNSKSVAARNFFHSLDMMIGVNNGEGGLIVLIEWLRKLRQRDLNNLVVSVSDMRDAIAPYMIAEVVSPPDNKSLAALKAAVTYEYVDWQSPENNDLLRTNLFQLSSDVAFFVPAVQTMLAHAGSPTVRSYFFEFSAEPPWRLLPTPIWFRGANHADEIQYVFGAPFQNFSLVESHHYNLTPRNGTYTQADINLSLGMITAWTNFAKSSDPNMPADITQYINTTWPGYDHINQRYLELSLNMSSTSVKHHFSARSVAFWTKLLPAIVEDTSIAN